MKGNLSLLLRILKLIKQYQCFRPEHAQPPSTCSKFIYYCVQITGRAVLLVEHFKILFCLFVLVELISKSQLNFFLSL